MTLPDGVKPGDTIHVQAPDGRTNAIVVPPGMYAGSQFTVQFETAPPPTGVATPQVGKYDNPPVAPSAPVPYEPDIAVGGSTPQPQGQDDFASGFGGSNNRY